MYVDLLLRRSTNAGKFIYVALHVGLLLLSSEDSPLTQGNKIFRSQLQSQEGGGVVSYAVTQTLLGSADERRFQDSSFRTSQGQEEYDSLQKPY